MAITKWIKAVSYLRMSSGKQEKSIDDQRTAVIEYAAKHGYDIIHEYVDEAVSGWKSQQRKDFQRMIADAERGEFKVILCWDQDRFSRFEPMEAFSYFQILRKAGVKIITLAQGELNFDTDFGWLIVSVTQHAKAQYCKDLARNTARGLRKVRLAGQWSGGVPLGYRLRLKQRGGSDKQTIERLELGDPDDIATVRRIFDLRAKGYGLGAIAKRLNADGIATTRGRLWHAKTIRALLKRPAYLGHSAIGLHSRAKYEKLTPEPVTVENTHPAIIDKKTWDRVQAMPKMGLRANGRNGSEGAPLSGLLICGRCGSAMHAATMRSTKLYLCSKYHAGHGCGHCHVDRDALLKAVARKIREFYLMGSRAKLEKEIQREQDRRQTPKIDQKAIAKKLDKLDRQIERAAGRILMVDDSAVANVEAQLLALKEQRAKLADSLNAKAAAPRRSAKAIADQLWQLNKLFVKASPTVIRLALKQIVAGIVLNFEPAGQTGRGKRYRFTGGMIQLSEGGLLP